MDTNEFLHGLSARFDRLDEKLDDIRIEVAKLNERSKNDNKRLDSLEKDVSSLKKWAYIAFIPFSIVVSLVLGINFIPPML